MTILFDGSSPAPVYVDAANTTSCVTGTFTPPAGSIVIAKGFNSDATQTFGTPTGLTFTSQVNVGTAGTFSRSAIFTATGGGSAITVTMTFAASSQEHGLIVEVYTGATLAG